MIFAGAIGNVIDSVFYGIIFDNAPEDAPFSLFYGQVVDMFYIEYILTLKGDKEWISIRVLCSIALSLAKRVRLPVHPP